jgi:hypothetical protein
MWSSPHGIFCVSNKLAELIVGATSKLLFDEKVVSQDHVHDL